MKDEKDILILSLLFLSLLFVIAGTFLGVETFNLFKEWVLFFGGPIVAIATIIGLFKQWDISREQLRHSEEQAERDRHEKKKQWELNYFTKWTEGIDSQISRLTALSYDRATDVENEFQGEAVLMVFGNALLDKEKGARFFIDITKIVNLLLDLEMMTKYIPETSPQSGLYLLYISKYKPLFLHLNERFTNSDYIKGSRLNLIIPNNDEEKRKVLESNLMLAEKRISVCYEFCNPNKSPILGRPPA